MALTYLDTQMIEQPTIFPELSVTSLRVGNIPESTSITGDLTVYGQVTALSGFNVIVSSTTTSSALSVSNFQAFPALNVYQAPSHPVISVFRNNTGNIATIRDTGLTISGTITGTNALINANTSTDAVRITQIGSGNALVVEDDTNPDATPFVVKNSGYVGIGTTFPLQQLHLSGGSYTGIRVTGSAGPLIDFQNTAAPAGSKYFRILQNTSGYTVFENITDDYNISTSRITILGTNGNVGINTAGSSKLHVRAAGSLDGLILDGGANSSWYRIMPGNLVYAGAFNGITQGGDNAFIFTSGVPNSGSLVIAPWATTTGGIRMLSSGLVGIGTAFPNQTLTVAGNVSATGTASVSALNIVSGKVFPKTTFNNLVSALAINVNGTTLYMPLLSAI